MSVSILAGYLPGCIGRVTALHASYYQPLVGFGLAFECKVARELADVCEYYDDRRDGLWLARTPDGIQGSIAIDGSRADAEGAHLRWFIASDRVRGQGVGTALIAAAMAFCDERAYRRVYLWTFDGLQAARALYERAGFELVHQQRGSQWSTEVEEQRFERCR